MLIKNLLACAALAGLLLTVGCAQETESAATPLPQETQPTVAEPPEAQPPVTATSETPTSTNTAMTTAPKPEILSNPEKLTEAQWKERLTEEQYYVARKSGTERPFKNEYWDEKTPGTYLCVCCNQPLYDSAAKYKSGTGWPSFYQPISPKAVNEKADNTLFSRRTEITCSNCDAHLGHVFDDGPQPTGLRYCMNSAAMKLLPKDDAADAKKPVAKE